jgi:hypothetical protein
LLFKLTFLLIKADVCRLSLTYRLEHFLIIEIGSNGIKAK